MKVGVIGTSGFLLAVEEGGGGEGEVSGLPPLEPHAGRLLLEGALAHHRLRVVAADRHELIFLFLLAFHLLTLRVLGIVCLHPPTTVARRSRFTATPSGGKSTPLHQASSWCVRRLFEEDASCSQWENKW